VRSRFAPPRCGEVPSEAFPPVHAEAVVIATNFEATRSSLRVSLKTTLALGSRRELRNEVTQAVERGVQRIVVDCEQWTELDLMLLSTLVNCASACDERGTDFELENLDDSLRHRIDTLRLAERLGITA
jgi:anti-anti-sigma regulatory factor